MASTCPISEKFWVQILSTEKENKAQQQQKLYGILNVLHKNQQNTNVFHKVNTKSKITSTTLGTC